jgi:KDO2-lipid IV(A) lauroyltransferase
VIDRIRERFVAAGYRVGWGLIKTLPPGLAQGAFRAAADAANVRNGRGTAQLRRNLRRVVGPAAGGPVLDELVRAALRSYARYWCETFRFETMDHAAVLASLSANGNGVEHYWSGLERGRGLIFALSHSGNWDASGLWLAAHSGPFTTVAERVRPVSLYDRFVAYRESLGMEVVPLTGGARSPTSVLTERLRQNRVVCLLADRDLSHNGIEVCFFGQRARMPPGPAMLAATTGASLHVVTTYFAGDDGWGHEVSPAVELGGGRLREQVVRGTQSVADALAAGIARHPHDWHMRQPLWLADLPASGGQQRPGG